MQVSDCEQLMRATLTAARILTLLRGMHPVGTAGVDVDIEKWLQHSAFIEDLGEHAHADMARAFFIDMLAHATKDLVNRAADEASVAAEEPIDAAVRRAAQSTTPAHQALRMGSETCLPDRLLRYFELFILRLQPLTFVAPSGMPRPHPMLDYRIAVVIHTGLRLATINSSITSGLDRLRKLRIRHAALVGGDNCSCRLFVIVWRDEFHPIHGKQTTRLMHVIQDINGKIAKENLSVEAYNVIELQYDATQHELVPLHTVVDIATEAGLKTIAPAEFPTLYADDPQAKLRDFRPGQIIRIERRDVELGYDELYYRMVRKRT